MVRIMLRAIWLILLGTVVLTACSQDEAPPVRLDLIPTPDPAAAAMIQALSSSSGFYDYPGLESVEEAILTADVIARVSLLSMRTNVKQVDTRWYPVLEFRFRVHEYLKGSGSNEIGGLTYLGWESSEAEAQAVAVQMPDAHDTRWDNREAIVFLDTEHVRYSVVLRGGPGEHWFGPMQIASWDAISVSSIHRKRWLPEVAQSVGARTASSQKLFLTDAPGSPGSLGSSGASARVPTSTLPTISLGNLKSRISTLEAEANAGGTDEYRACIELGYWRLRYVTYMLQGGSPQWREEHSILSGQPAGTFVSDIGGAPTKDRSEPPLVWKFIGLDREMVRYERVNFRPLATSPGYYEYTNRLVTTRPLPADNYEYFPYWRPPYCNQDLSSIERAIVVHLTVTAPARSVHEAFFDPVAIGSGVGADGTNGVLDPASFALGGVTTAVASLKWESGTVTLDLSPTASLADYAIDFIDVNGTTTLSLTSDNASTTPLAWTVPDKPWAAGDLLMLRIYKPISNDATLSGLALSGVDLTFDPATTTYTASVPATTTQTTVTPTTNHASATYVVKLAGVTDLDGTIPLAAGDNVITIDVTAEDATTTKTYTVTVTRAAPQAPVTVTLAPRPQGSATRVNITIEWNDPQTCDGQYLVALYTSADYMVQFLGYTPASETPSRTTESATNWDLSRFPDWFAGVTCYPNASSDPARDLGRVSLRAVHPDSN